MFSKGFQSTTKKRNLPGWGVPEIVCFFEDEMPASWAGSGSRDPGVHGIITNTIAITTTSILLLELLPIRIYYYCPFLFLNTFILTTFNRIFTATALRPQSGTHSQDR